MIAMGANAFSGKYSLRCSSMINYGTDLYSAWVASAPIYVSSPDTYTLCFATKSSRVREFGVQFGTGRMETIISGPSWLSHTLTFQTDSGNNTITFYLGRESSDVWFDEVYLFKGNADIFRRDFENGTVFVNATPDTRTIPINGSFRRIRGTQDPINDGSSVGSRLTISGYDAAILVRVP